MNRRKPSVNVSYFPIYIFHEANLAASAFFHGSLLWHNGGYCSGIVPLPHSLTLITSTKVSPLCVMLWFYQYTCSYCTAIASQYCTKDGGVSRHSLVNRCWCCTHEELVNLCTQKLQSRLLHRIRLWYIFGSTQHWKLILYLSYVHGLCMYTHSYSHIQQLLAWLLWNYICMQSHYTINFHTVNP